MTDRANGRGAPGTVVAHSPEPEFKTVAAAGVRPWYTLILLMLVGSVSLLDRQIITVLAVDIKRDLGLNDSEIGFVYGTLFAVFYALFSIPLGRLADGWVRTRQVAVSLTSWSLATAACAFATGFGSLIAARVFVAVGEAGAGPAAYSLIADLFSKSKRATAYAIYGSSSIIGAGLSLALGGVVVGMWNSFFPGGKGWFDLVAWQAAFLVAAMPGLVLALLIIAAKEPLRGQSDGIIQPNEKAPFRKASAELMCLAPPLPLLRFRQLCARAPVYYRNLALMLVLLGAVFAVISVVHSVLPAEKIARYATVSGIAITSHVLQWSVFAFGCYAILSWVETQRLSDEAAFKVMWSSPAYICVLIIACFNLLILYGYMAWSIPYLIIRYNADASEIGVKVGLASIVAGGLGTIAGGVLGDRAKPRLSTGRLWVILATTTLPVPVVLVAFWQPTLDGFVFWFTVSVALQTGWFPCCTATLHDLILPRMRGSAIAIMNLGVTIIGLGTGPYLVGLISDATGDLRAAILSLFTLLGVVWAAIIVAMYYLPRDERSLLKRARIAGEAI